MAWYNDIGNGIVDGLKTVGGAIFGAPGDDAERQRKQLLYDQAAGAGGFADRQQSQFIGNQALARGNIAALQAQASGQNSLSAEQLRQGLQQSLAQQRSLAAGASPNNAVAAARTAAIQSARLASGLSGQQALVGLQERNQAQQNLAGAISNYGAQALSATQAGRGQAIQGYGAGNAGTPEKSNIEKYGPAVLGALALSDRTKKTAIKDGDEPALKMLGGLRAYMYRYRDEERNGKGERLGVMAQELERAGLGNAVMDTPAGKMVDTAQLTTSNTAMLAAMHRRMERLERESGRSTGAGK